MTWNNSLFPFSRDHCPTITCTNNYVYVYQKFNIDFSTDRRWRINERNALNKLKILLILYELRRMKILLVFISQFARKGHPEVKSTTFLQTTCNNNFFLRKNERSRFKIRLRLQRL